MTVFSTVLLDLGRGLREGCFMLWETLWALVLGFGVSGIVQAFVSKRRMTSLLGTHRTGAVARASFYGMVSSSCSYAASAMSKSLIAKGADMTTAIIFMVASTNLVVELGVVLFVLLGWQFAVAEFVGGPVMIVLLALAGTMVFSGPVADAVVRRLRAGVESGSGERAEVTAARPWRTKAGWSDAANYALADATMLRRELILGYAVAGLVAALVPSSWWNHFFLHGHGTWTDLENALVGPLIAVVSWVCSVGNVPLAAALWSGGISFGGVVAFVFADLISMPLLLVYRRMYGGRLTVRIAALLYTVMVLAALATHGLFALAHTVPRHRTVSLPVATWSWNYTTYLDVLALVGGVALVWLARQRVRLGGGQGYATDPVCHMQVRTADAPVTVALDGRTYYFCCDGCANRFTQDPMAYLTDEPPIDA